MMENTYNIDFFFLALPHSLQNLSSSTSDWTHAFCSESAVPTIGLPENSPIMLS